MERVIFRETSDKANNNISASTNYFREVPGISLENRLLPFISTILIASASAAYSDIPLGSATRVGLSVLCGSHPFQAYPTRTLPDPFPRLTGLQQDHFSPFEYLALYLQPVQRLGCFVETTTFLDFYLLENRTFSGLTCSKQKQAESVRLRMGHLLPSTTGSTHGEYAVAMMTLRSVERTLAIVISSCT